jgi:hypothetical protein
MSLNFFEKLFQKPWEKDRPKRAPRKKTARVRAVLVAEIVPEPEKEKNPERVVELGIEILDREGQRLDSQKTTTARRGGFMLATALAMVMATLGAPEKAQAQWKPASGGLAGQVISGTMSSIRGASDRAYNRKVDGIESGYIGQLQKIEDQENEIFSAYNRQKEQLELEGKRTEIKELEREYGTKMEQIAKMKLDLRRSCNSSKTRAGIQEALIGGAIKVFRGW